MGDFARRDSNGERVSGEDERQQELLKVGSLVIHSLARLYEVNDMDEAAVGEQLYELEKAARNIARERPQRSAAINIEAELFAIADNGRDDPDPIAQEDGPLFEVMRRLGEALDGWFAADPAPRNGFHLSVRAYDPAQEQDE